MNRHELGAVGERALDLNLRDHRRHPVHHGVGRQNRRAEAHDLGNRTAVADQLEDLGGDQSDRFGMIELESAGAAFARQLAGRKNQQLVDFSRRQMHGGFLRRQIIARLAPNVTKRHQRPARSCCVIIPAMSTRYGWIGLGLALSMIVACGSEPPKPAAVTAAPAPAPPPEARVKVYVTNEASGDLTVIDGERQTVIGTYPLGKRPRGIKVSPDGKSLFVALSGSPNAGPGVDPKTLPPPDRSADGIGEVDVATHKVKRVIQAGNDPEQLDISADGQRLYVANEDAAQVSVVDVPSGKVIAT